MQEREDLGYYASQRGVRTFIQRFLATGDVHRYPCVIGFRAPKLRFFPQIPLYSVLIYLAIPIWVIVLFQGPRGPKKNTVSRRHPFLNRNKRHS